MQLRILHVKRRNRQLLTKIILTEVKDSNCLKPSARLAGNCEKAINQEGRDLIGPEGNLNSKNLSEIRYMDLNFHGRRDSNEYIYILRGVSRRGRNNN